MTSSRGLFDELESAPAKPAESVAVDPATRPLADRLRPSSLEDFCGQSHLLAAGSTLRMALEQDRLHSMVFWGPPGTGKTTLARMIATHCDAAFMSLSAVLSGVKDIRESVAKARDLRERTGRPSVLFVDEVHRFNKAQQDAFLPHIEDGTLHFVGATTENPSFELNNALLSRVRVYVLRSLETGDLRRIIDRALDDEQHGLAGTVLMSEANRDRLAELADGDARQTLVLLELAASCAREATDNEDGDNEVGDSGQRIIDEDVLREVTRDSLRRFDKGGDAFFDQISALHKCMRGSDPDAALYWYCRMLDGGCDPLYIARRVLRFASEDIGNADPRAAELALYAWQSYERLGSPEGDLAVAHAIVFASVAAKSNAVYTAFKRARQFVSEHGSSPVPMHLRNAPTSLMKELGHGDGYRYAHDEADGFAAGANYFPDELGAPVFYEPVSRGLEIRIAERVADLRARNAAATTAATKSDKDR